MGFGAVIREARQATGLSQVALAEKVGVSRSAIYDWESEKYAPTDGQNLARLEGALGLTAGALYKMIFVDGNPTPPPADRGPGGKETVETEFQSRNGAI
ncbi:helix-turn-helix transcriptional regulator [Aminithiophilus ramosus]|uniref:Helix-turn-helix transcriptional regulator n=2 Tax=Aminithiophilus ramosus TaxID=3029084 RepID=A0A9Q7AEJ7_9BACT|nr:helix-turn-helix transcriptional regulator [Aminithiophilus ramosus]